MPADPPGTQSPDVVLGLGAQATGSPERDPEPQAHLSDAELSQALGRGEVSALSVIYDRHAGLVYGIAMRVLGNPQEAEDLTQDIFLSLTRRSSYDPARGSLRTYLAILTRSRSVDRIRARTSRQQRSLRWQSDPGETMTTSTPLDEAFRQDRSQEVRQALATLPDQQQHILYLSYYEGLSQSEIARQLGIPLGTVKARARRGLIKLRALLKARNHPSCE